MLSSLVLRRHLGSHSAPAFSFLKSPFHAVEELCQLWSLICFVLWVVNAVPNMCSSSSLLWILFFHSLKTGSLDGKESACSEGDPGLIPGWKDPLEKGMAAHSSILVWKIPWTEEPGRLQSTGSQRVGHNWMTNTFNPVSINTLLIRIEDRETRKYKWFRVNLSYHCGWFNLDGIAVASHCT